jgi:hypothetical protein
MSSFLSEHGSNPSLNSNNVDELVKPANALTEKIIYFHAKNQAIEDTMNVLKKAFEKENIDVDTYLQEVRRLSKKQFKQVYNMKKLMSLGKQSNPAQ